MRLLTFSLGILSVLSLNCKKEKFGDGKAENVPLTVELGESIFFTNGESVDFSAEFKIWTADSGISGFCQRSDDGVADNIQFVINSKETGFIDPKFLFDRSIGDDSFEEFKQINKDSSFLGITLVDTIKMEIGGRFEVEFEKTDSPKFTRKKKYPDKILIQGVFHERYTIL